jgi:hypothetical protein
VAYCWLVLRGLCVCACTARERSAREGWMRERSEGTERVVLQRWRAAQRARVSRAASRVRSYAARGAAGGAAPTLVAAAAASSAVATACMSHSITFTQFSKSPTSWKRVGAREAWRQHANASAHTQARACAKAAQRSARRRRALSALSKSVTIEIQRPVCLANWPACVCGRAGKRRQRGRWRGRSAHTARLQLARFRLDDALVVEDVRHAWPCFQSVRRERSKRAEQCARAAKALTHAPSFTALASSSVTVAIAADAVRRARSAQQPRAQAQRRGRCCNTRTRRKRARRREARAILLAYRGLPLRMLRQHGAEHGARGAWQGVRSAVCAARAGRGTLPSHTHARAFRCKHARRTVPVTAASGEAGGRRCKLYRTFTTQRLRWPSRLLPRSCRHTAPWRTQAPHRRAARGWR